MDDICPCVWISFNTSGVVEIKNGHLYFDDVQYYSLSELKVLSSGTYDSGASASSSNEFHMEIGRTLFLFLRMCNVAERCSTKLVNTLIITNENSQLSSSTNGEFISATLTVADVRRKRSTAVVTVETPDGM